MAFNGISNLRDTRENVKVEPWQLSEIKKCVKDPIYFIKNYVYINVKDKGFQLFNLYDFQEELIHKFNDNRFNCVKFPRQCGKCLDPDTVVDIMNSDGEVMQFTLGEFYNLMNENNIN